MTKPKMQDVARESGVSQTTVSFVLNGKNLDRIPKETQEKIWAVAKRLNYRVQSTGLSLATGKTGTIGLLYDETYEYLMHDGFCSTVFLGIQGEIKKNNLHLSFATVSDKDNSLPAMLETYSVDGVIFLAAKSERVIDILENYNIPTILVDPVKHHSRVHELRMDNTQGAILAVTHLLKLGHKRIGCISAKYESMDAEPISFIERRQGAEKFLAKEGLPPEPELIVIGEIWNTDNATHADPAYQAGYDAMAQLMRLENPPTAIFSVNDRLAMGALASARDMNISIPQQLSLIGFDDIPESARTFPPLTTISIPKKEMGQVAVNRLLELIKNKTLAPAPVPLENKLMIRQSTSNLLPQNTKPMNAPVL